MLLEYCGPYHIQLGILDRRGQAGRNPLSTLGLPGGILQRYSGGIARYCCIHGTRCLQSFEGGWTRRWKGSRGGLRFSSPSTCIWEGVTLHTWILASMEAPVLCRKIHYCLGLQPPYHGGLLYDLFLLSCFSCESSGFPIIPYHVLGVDSRQSSISIYQGSRGPGGAI